MRLKELAGARVRYGYRRLHVLLQREGWRVNHKRLYRLYSEEGLSIRTRSPRRRRACRYRSGRVEAGGMNDVWAMDFMSDRLFDDRPFRILTVVDCCTREALSIAPRTNFRAHQVIEELDRLARLRGKPGNIASTTSYVGVSTGSEGKWSLRAGTLRHGWQRDPGGLRRQGSGLDHSKRRVRRSGPDRPQHEIQNQAEDPNIIYGIAARPNGTVREGSSRLAPPPRRRGGSRRRV